MYANLKQDKDKADREFFDVKHRCNSLFSQVNE
jgi:hypothetical protein